MSIRVADYSNYETSNFKLTWLLLYSKHLCSHTHPTLVSLWPESQISSQQSINTMLYFWVFVIISHENLPRKKTIVTRNSRDIDIHTAYSIWVSTFIAFSTPYTLTSADTFLKLFYVNFLGCYMSKSLWVFPLLFPEIRR